MEAKIESNNGVNVPGLLFCAGGLMFMFAGSKPIRVTGAILAVVSVCWAVTKYKSKKQPS